MNEALTNRLARILAAVAVLVLAGALLGCGSDDEGSDGDNDDSQQNFPPQVVRDSEIEGQDSGSPERALLEWWQSFQFSDATAVVAATSPATLNAIGEKQLRALVKTRGQGLQGIEVLGSSGEGDTASVRAGLLTFQPEKAGAPPPTTPTASKPTTFAMVKVGDEWLFRETAYLQPMIEGLKRQAEQQKNQQQGEGGSTETEGTDTTATT
jgi:hypothetical protein